jgi:uncharacterized phage protein (TIGR01671 family)
MNREIKFRYFHKGEMIYIDLYNYNTGVLFKVYENQSKTSKFMQFTGLKDKNDNDIYEGDIVQWSDEYDDLSENEIVKAVVKFSENDTLGWHFGKLRKLTGNKLWCDLVPDSMEVIGNIYQNADILTIEK